MTVRPAHVPVPLRRAAAAAPDEPAYVIAQADALDEMGPLEGALR